MLDNLIESKKISEYEAFIYKLFTTNTDAVKYYTDKQKEVFLDQAPFEHMRASILGYTEGRRSIFREIMMIIDKIDALSKSMIEGEVK